MDDYILYGAEGSPYSVKMRAVLRYKRLPHRWTHPRQGGNIFEHVKAPVIPVIRFPDGSWRNDSTPMIRALEAAHPERSVVPEDEADAFLCWLLEDFADEWGTKAMFHYRWAPDADRDVNAFNLIQLGLFGMADRPTVEVAAGQFRDRQVGRMALVGCTPENASVIEESARRVLALIEAGVERGPWLFGTRPSAADFGWYGQLWQLLRDPTPRAMLRADYPAAFAWLEMADDASGWEGEWRPAGAAALGIARLAAELYLPFLAANVGALKAGKDRVELELLGRPYVQAPFKYQARCLADLRALYAGLSPDARTRVDSILGGPGALA
jgi:glutathione S-transferase